MSRLGNVGAVFKNKVVSMFQDPEALKTDSLILASLVLVISRILVANVSAMRAMGTPEGPYRYRESIRTDMREICGWTFGFIVLRQVQNWIRKTLANPMGITKVGEPVKYPLLKNLKAAVSGKTPAEVELNLSTMERLEYNAAKASKKLLNFLNKHKAFHKLGKTEAERMLTMYKAVPIALGSIPAVFLAGYALERFTRDYSDQVVDLVSKTFNKPKTDMPNASAVVSPAPVSPAVASAPQAPQFNQLSLSSLPPVLPMQSAAQFAGRRAVNVPVQPFRSAFSPLQI